MIRCTNTTHMGIKLWTKTLCILYKMYNNITYIFLLNIFNYMFKRALLFGIVFEIILLWFDDLNKNCL